MGSAILMDGNTASKSVYIAIKRFGDLTVSQISQQTGLHDRRVRKILERNPEVFSRNTEVRPNVWSLK